MLCLSLFFLLGISLQDCRADLHQIFQEDGKFKKVTFASQNSTWRHNGFTYWQKKLSDFGWTISLPNIENRAKIFQWTLDGRDPLVHNFEHEGSLLTIQTLFSSASKVLLLLLLALVLTTTTTDDSWNTVNVSLTHSSNSDNDSVC